MSESEEKYVSTYEGNGKLNQQDCSFEVGQRPDAQIIMACDFSDRPKPLNLHGIEFSGLTDNGTRVSAEGPFQNSQAFPGENAETFHISYGLWKLTIGDPDWSKAHSVTFAITNFIFCGNDEHAGGRADCLNTLKLTLDGLRVSFEKVADYDEIYNSVVGGQKTEVTCELTIQVAGRSRDEIRKIANTICDLLTIAKGRKISWINYKVFDANSSEIFTFHENRLTDPMTGYELIDFRQAKRAINYLERGYPAYEQFDSHYPTMLNGVASMMFDSNSTRFTLTHALVMFSMVDALSKKVCNNDHFESRIKRLNNLYGVCLTSKERKYFVDSRNSVVHELKFHTSDTKKEYERCYHVFHRLLLRILDYQSEYFDITLQRGDPRFLVSKLRACPKQ